MHTVTQVTIVGDQIQIVTLGKPNGSARWREPIEQTWMLPNNAKTRAAYHLGRKVRIEMRPL